MGAGRQKGSSQKRHGRSPSHHPPSPTGQPQHSSGLGNGRAAEIVVFVPRIAAVRERRPHWVACRGCHPPTAIGEVTAAAIRKLFTHQVARTPLPVAHHAVAAEACPERSRGMVAVHVEEAALSCFPGRVAGGAHGYGLPAQGVGLAADGGGVGGDGTDKRKS
jgi:hypothetical protein